MRKNESFSKKRTLSISPLARRVLWLGYALIAIPLFLLVIEVTAAPVFSIAKAAYFLTMAEHIIAALALLTALSYLAERVAREVHKEK